MIRNVVFDMGGVLIRYDFSKYCTRYAPDPDDHALIMDELFGSVEWVQLDRGAIEQAQAIRSISARLPARLHGAVGQILNNWHEGAAPIDGMDALIRRLRAAGYGVYLLSNAAKTIHAYAPRLPGYDCFNGLFFSADWHLLKPEIAIYRAFCDEFHLDAGECVFIDDLSPNVEGAIHAGLHGLVFRGVERLRGELAAMGVTL